MSTIRATESGSSQAAGTPVAAAAASVTPSAAGNAAAAIQNVGAAFAAGPTTRMPALTPTPPAAPAAAASAADRGSLRPRSGLDRVSRDAITATLSYLPPRDMAHFAIARNRGLAADHPARITREMQYHALCDQLGADWFINLHDLMREERLRTAVNQDRSASIENQQRLKQGLPPLASVLPFSSLRISGLVLSSPHLGDDQLTPVFTRFPKFYILSLGGCQRITNAGLRALHQHVCNRKIAGLQSLLTHCIENRTTAFQTFRQCLLQAGSERAGDEQVIRAAQEAALINFVRNCALSLDSRTRELAEDVLVDIRSLVLSRCPQISDEGLIPLAEACENLHELELADCTSITDAGLQTLFNAACRGIAAGRQILLAHAQQSENADLRRLAELFRRDSSPERSHALLEYCNRSPDMRLQDLAADCRGLTRVNLNSCRQITDLSIAVLMHVFAGDLVDLSLAGMAITDQALLHQPAPGLSTSLPRLKSLNLGVCRAITNTGLSSIASRAPHLQTLHLTDCREIDDRGINALAWHCPRLRRLDVHECVRLTDASATALGSGCGDLRYLHITGCTQISDAGLVAIAEGCQNLEWLDLSSDGRRLITDRGIAAIGRGCQNLSILHLTDCDHISDAAIRDLARSCPHLREVQRTSSTRAHPPVIIDAQALERLRNEPTRPTTAGAAAAAAAADTTTRRTY